MRMPHLMLMLTALLLSGLTPIHEATPEYARWTVQALEAVKAKYKEAAIKDFLYAGCQPRSRTVTDYVYKYWLAEEGREFGVYVTLSIDPPSGRVIQAKVRASDGSDAPHVARWLNLAKKALIEKFPGTQIHDYRPYDCQAVTDTAGTQTFRFWLTDNRLADVTILHDMCTGRVLKVDVRILGSVVQP